MRVDLGLLLLLLALCGSGAQGEDGGLREEWTKQNTEQTTPDIWAEVRALRDMVVEHKVELRNMEVRVKESESQVDELKAELIVSKMLVEQLQRENSELQTRLSSSEKEILVIKSSVDQLERENADQATELTSLKNRLTATEKTTSDLEKANAELQTRLSSSESELVVSKSRIDQLERENADHKTRLTATESKTSDVEKENAELQTRLSSSESEILISKSRIDQLERENAEKPKVAFYAAVTNAGTVGTYNTDITLKYSKVYTNIGDAYSPSTGFFTAPVKGVYYFQFTVCGSQANYVGLQVFKNNQLIMYNEEWNDNGHFRYITNSVILELTAGDEIHVVLPSGHSLYDSSDNRSTFSGALLFPL